MFQVFVLAAERQPPSRAKHVQPGFVRSGCFAESNIQPSHPRVLTARTRVQVVASQCCTVPVRLPLLDCTIVPAGGR